MVLLFSQIDVPQPKPHTLIIGIGNEYRRDDGVGLAVVRGLKTKRLTNVTIQEATGEGAALMEMWTDVENVILIDAVVSGAAPGTVHRLDAKAHSIPAEFFTQSTHAFGVAQAIELARTLNRLSRSLLFFGIEGKDFSMGIGLSPEVEEAVKKVVGQIENEMS